MQETLDNAYKTIRHDAAKNEMDFYDEKIKAAKGAEKAAYEKLRDEAEKRMKENAPSDKTIESPKPMDGILGN